jgi:hypothetical protein
LCFVVDVVAPPDGFGGRPPLEAVVALATAEDELPPVAVPPVEELPPVAVVIDLDELVLPPSFVADDVELEEQPLAVTTTVPPTMAAPMPRRE